MRKKNLSTKEPRDDGWKQSVYSSMRELGFGPAEILLYTTSIEIGPTSISDLAKRLHLSRPSIYKIIGNLAAAGLATPPDKKEIRSKFIVEPATAILESLRTKSEACSHLDRTLSKSMPEVLAIYNRTARPAGIKVFSGTAQLKYLHDSVLDAPNGNIRFFGSVLTFSGMLTPDEYAAWVEKKVRAGIWNKALLPSSDYARLMPNPEAALREIRIFTDTPSFDTNFQLFAGKVIFWWPETMVALLIEDPSMFKMMESIFTTYWNTAIPLKEFGRAHSSDGVKE